MVFEGKEIEWEYLQVQILEVLDGGERVVGVLQQVRQDDLDLIVVVLKVGVGHFEREMTTCSK